MRVVLLLLAIVWGNASAEQINFLYYREQGKAIFQELLDEFTAQSQHQVTLYQITSESLKPALIKSVLQGTAADVAFAPSDIIGITEQAKLSVVPREFIESNTPNSLLLTATIDEQLHGIPILQGNHLMLFYNRRLVEQPASSWQGLLDQKNILMNKALLPLAGIILTCIGSPDFTVPSTPSLKV